MINNFKGISEWIYEASGIEFLNDTIRFEIYRNKQGKASIEGRVNYVGPLQRKINPYRIKIDLTADEIVVLPPVIHEVHHPYSDKLSGGIKAYCYSFAEVFAEKIRALSERARPRDLYDVIHLYRHAVPSESRSILEVLKKKCDYKALPIPTLQLFEEHPKLHELESEWENMLAHQVSKLAPKENFWRELPNILKWLYGDNANQP